MRRQRRDAAGTGRADGPAPELTVDLGLVEPAEADEEWSPAPPRWRDRWSDWWAGWRDPAVRARRRGIPLVAAAVVLAGLPTGSTQPVVTGIVTVPLTYEGSQPYPDGRIQLLSDLVVVPESDTGYAAYDAATGEPRWTVHSDGPVTFIETAGVLMQMPHGIARDPATGELIWNRSDLTVAPGAGLGLQVVPMEPPARQLAAELRGIDLATGEVRWTRRGNGIQGWLPGGQPVVVTASPDGTLGLRDLTTGELLVEQTDQLPSTEGRHNRRWSYPVTHRDGVLVMLIDTMDSPTVLRGYRTDTLTPVWERPVADPVTVALPCADAICVLAGEVDDQNQPTTGATGGELPRVEVFDPVSGDVLAPGEPGHPLSGLSGTVDGRDRAGSPIQDILLQRLIRQSRHQTPQPLEPVSELPVRAAGQVPLADPDFCTAAEHRLACRYDDQLWVWTF